ncbi:unnamed protein product, partial [Pylaiella littoralis]
GLNLEGCAGHAAAVPVGRSGGGIEEVGLSTGGARGGLAVPVVGVKPAVIAWRGARRKTPGLLKRTVFAASDPEAAYFRAHLLLWLASMALLVADRFLWNLWPRQAVIPSVGGSCGGGGLSGD